MNTSHPKLLGAFVLSALLTFALPAATVVDWKFDAYTAGQTITTVTSNSITLNANAVSGANAVTVAAKPNSGAAVSASFSGNNYLSTSGVVSALNFGTSQAFTIEGWFNLNSITNAQTLISNRTTTNVLNTGWFAVETAAAGAGVTFTIKQDTTASSSFAVTASQILSTGTWYYFAASRNTADQLSVSLYSTDALLATGSNANARSGSLTSTSATFLGARGSDQSTRLSNGSLLNEIRISDAYLTGNQLLWTSAIPEPSSTAALAGLGALVCVTALRRRRQN